jgi:hypothetical protein
MFDMNTLFEFSRCAGWQPKASLIGLGLVLAIAAGCGKSNAPTTSAAPPSSDSAHVSAAPSAPAAANTQQVTAANPDIPKPEMQAMNRALLDWERANKRRPKTFQEFASSTDFQVPTPPPGKKFAFNARGFIVLEDASSN